MTRVRQHRRRTHGGRTTVGAHMRNRTDAPTGTVPHTKADAVRFAKLRADYLAKDATLTAYRNELDRKYSDAKWAGRGEKAKLAQITVARERVGEKIYTLLDRLNPYRNEWRGFPSYWVRGELTWEDAITLGRMKATPPAAYGYSTRDMEALSGPVRTTESRKAGF